MDALLAACWEETLDAGLYALGEDGKLDLGKVLQGDRFGRSYCANSQVAISRAALDVVGPSSGDRSPALHLGGSHDSCIIQYIIIRTANALGRASYSIRTKIDALDMPARVHDASIRMHSDLVPTANVSRSRDISMAIRHEFAIACHPLTRCRRLAAPGFVPPRFVGGTCNPVSVLAPSKRSQQLTTSKRSQHPMSNRPNASYHWTEP